MKRFITVCLLLTFFCPGCATLQKKSAKLNHGISQAKVIELFGEPVQKVPVGITEKNLSVEVWEYQNKKVPLLKKDEFCIIIFVDKELYFWTTDSADKIFEELIKLGVVKEDMQIGPYEQNKALQDSAAQAENMRRTMETIRTYQFFKETQMQIQHQQQIQTLRQNQLFPTPKPVQPVQFQRPLKPNQR
ncbi:MAG: hypothetical protein HY810_07240 [Candidatus Omnitrophica bacterium]|nr:hypothetical protein [Candidatus Omnitrophota bacterium]